MHQFHNRITMQIITVELESSVQEEIVHLFILKQICRILLLFRRSVQSEIQRCWMNHWSTWILYYQTFTVFEFNLMFFTALYSILFGKGTNNMKIRMCNESYGTNVLLSMQLLSKTRNIRRFVMHRVISSVLDIRIGSERRGYSINHLCTSSTY